MIEGINVMTLRADVPATQDRGCSVSCSSLSLLHYANPCIKLVLSRNTHSSNITSVFFFSVEVGKHAKT